MTSSPVTHAAKEGHVTHWPTLPPSLSSSSYLGDLAGSVYTLYLTRTCLVPLLVLMPSLFCCVLLAVVASVASAQQL